jgi:retron-type reverse transcriptase
MYEHIISIQNLCKAWSEFIKGKKNKRDVAFFSFDFSENIIALHNELQGCIYKHGGYKQFNISDPKPRTISKASVKDRLLHHAVYRILYPFFERRYIYHSYSCRVNKGTHRAIKVLYKKYNKVSKNDTKTCWVLQCDIRKFFDSINHDILVSILKRHIKDEDVIQLLETIIRSFCVQPNKGLPLGNLTSQLFVNVYMNEFDQFVEHVLKEPCYIRYADDFLFLSKNRERLVSIIPRIESFLMQKLSLKLHPKKVKIKTFSSGVDFLGWAHFTDHRTLRTSTKKRMMKKMKGNKNKETYASYIGLLKHGNGYKLAEELCNIMYNKA